MGIPKGKSKGGAGGKRGHSGMDHWVTTEEIKDASRKRRRLESKEVIRQELATGEKHFCARCGSTWEILSQPSSELIAAVAGAVRAADQSSGIELLHRAGLPLPSAKAIVKHISNVRGRCHRCDQPLAGDLHVECSNCEATNYNW